MERTFSQDERIRRAEEIYLKRQNLRNRTQRVTVTANNTPKNFKLFKKLALQITICVALYYIFHLISTTNYSFSNDTLSKTKEIISQDFDFYGVYMMVVENVNNYLYPEENKNGDTNNDNNNGNEENSNLENGEEQKLEEEQKSEEEGVNQSEVSYTEERETERIKHNYSFILPLDRRSNFIRIWR